MRRAGKVLLMAASVLAAVPSAQAKVADAKSDWRSDEPS